MPYHTAMELAKRFSAHHRPDQPIPATIGSALAVARIFAEQSLLEPALAARLAVVVDELVGNVLRHGRPGCEVRFALALTRRSGDGEVTITLEDDGPPFDPRTVPFAGPDGDSGGGVGLALVRAFAEIVGYERGDSVNRLSLRLRGSPPPDPRD
jgi:serine/threonine-protein kinase RsbW